MTDITCTYTGSRDEILVAYLYDDYSDSGPAERAAFAAHLQTCARCPAFEARRNSLRGCIGSR